MTTGRAYSIDFEKLNQHLLGAGESFLRSLFPLGKIEGHEFCIGSLDGEAGKSLRINLNTGLWKDFAFPECRGKDLISLYAAKFGLDQVKAARELQEKFGITPASEPPPRKPVDEWQICAPPEGAKPPTFIHSKYGPASKSWPYTDADGRVLFYISRYNLPDGDKQFLPWSWSDSKGDWVRKGFPGKRPLYGLPLLSQHPDKPVMLVEGEKACDAARELAGHVYVILTWAGGAQAFNKADFSTIKNRDVLLWPDADEPGVCCMRDLAPILAKQGCKVKLINVDDHSMGWDAADALSEGWDWAKLRAWAGPRAIPFLGAEIVRLDTVKAQATLDRGKPVPSDMWTVWDRAALLTANGRPIENIENVIRILNHTGDGKKIWYDTFHQTLQFMSPQGVREWTDSDTLKLTTQLQSAYGFRRIGDNTVYTAVRALGFANEKDSVLEWFNALRWDGVRRNENFFQDVYGAENTQYVRDVGMNFLRTICARATRPGCKVDNMVVLEGLQGLGKSESLSILGGGLHTETHESVDSKDFYLVLQGKLLVVISEMDSFGKADMKKVKSLITDKTDRYRKPYDRTAADHPRRCIFVGDTNEKTYLDDPTGARRFWPIRCLEINWDVLRSNREQYLAEAMQDLRDGKAWHIYDQAAAKAEQEQRRVVDEWEEHIGNYLVSRPETVVLDIIRDCLRIEIGKADKLIQMRVGRILRVLGWENKVTVRDGKATRVWVRG